MYPQSRGPGHGSDEPPSRMAPRNVSSSAGRAARATLLTRGTFALPSPPPRRDEKGESGPPASSSLGRLWGQGAELVTAGQAPGS